MLGWGVATTITTAVIMVITIIMARSLILGSHAHTHKVPKHGCSVLHANENGRAGGDREWLIRRCRRPPCCLLC